MNRHASVAEVTQVRSRRRVRNAVALLASLLELTGCNQLLGLDPPGRPFAAPVTSDSDAASPGQRSDTSSPLDASPNTNATAHFSSDPPGSDTTHPPDCTAAECVDGDSLCALGAVQVCRRGSNGCWVWSEAEPCPTATCADEKTCHEFEAGFDAGGAAAPCTGQGCAIALGAPCDTSDRCAEGACQDTASGARVCCAANCDAACKTCAADGRSCMNEADDSRCGDIQCPVDTPCRKYTADNVTEDRCRDGACGTAEAVCPFVARGEGKACADGLLCDDAGNCNVAKFAQGAPCETFEQCTTGNCANGVCCESECDGLCMDCRPGTGKCDVMPADDTDCFDVDCAPRDNCSVWTGDIVADRCVRLGACKSAQDCSFQPAEKGTLCQYGWLCDGKGECVQYPEVECGVSSCEVFSDLDGYKHGCCVHSANTELSTPLCTTMSECVQSWDDWHLGCDEHGDCNIAEEVCCGVVVRGMGQTECVATSQCNQFAEMYSASFVELCESPAMGSRPCSNGQACTETSSTLIGYKFCELP